MILRRVLIIIITCSCLLGFTNPSLKPPLAQNGRALSSSSFFTENKGQWDPSILFVGDTSFGKVAFTKDAVYYQMVKSVEETFETQLVKLSFVSPLVPFVQGDGLLSHYNNYFIGSDSSKWASYCHNFEKIEYLDVWTGIDLAYFFTPQGLKYEYYVDPQANIQDLQIRVEGAELATLGGSLQISTDLGNIRDSNLKVFDQNTKQAIPSSFQIQDNIISFTGIPEKREHTIVIDPLVWSTYLGGSKNDYALGVAVDKEGFVYICGGTESSDFPIVKKPNGKNNDDTYDGIITKLNATGTEIIFTTFLGGNDLESVSDISIDNDENIYVSGSTHSKDFPTSIGAMQEKLMGEREVFITKLDKSGSNILFSTFLGGSDTDTMGSLAIDKEGNSYISGHTGSKDFPVSMGVIQNKLKGEYDLFVSKINPTGTGLVFSTFFGGSGYEGFFESGMALDKEGNIYICGDTDSKNFPVTSGTIQQKLNGRIDTFIAKFNSTGTTIIYSTYLGGSDVEVAYGIAIDSIGNVYFCGNTHSIDYPVTLNPIQAKFLDGGADTFVTKINLDGTAILYSTYLGGNGWETAVELMADNDGNVTVCGRTASVNFPITPDSFQPKMSGNNDCFLTKINTADNKLLYSTFLGGSKVIERYENADESWDITSDTTGNIYLCGSTQCNDFPATEGVFQAKNKGKQDGFVLKFDFGLGSTPPDTTPPILEIISPEDNSTTTYNQIVVKGKAVDQESGIKSLTLNKEPIDVDASDGTFSHLFPLLVGENKIDLIATNGAKLTSTKTLTVIRTLPDTSPPQITIRYPASGTIAKENTIVLIGNVTDDASGVKELKVNGSVTSFSKKGEFEVTLLLQYGKNTIFIEVFDQAGNKSSTSLEVFLEEPKPIIIELWVDKPQAFIDGKPYVIDVPPMVRLGRTQVPLRFIAEGLKATVNYDAKTRKILINQKSTTLTMEIDNPVVLVESTLDEIKTSQEIILESAPYVYKGRTMVPVRFISEALGAKVEYGASERKITISMKR